MFERFGEVVNVIIIREPFTNLSRQFGFIYFKNKNDAEEAIKELNDTDLNGSRIIV